MHGQGNVNTVFCHVEYFHNLPEAMLRFGRIKKLNSSEETVPAIVREGSPGGRSDNTREGYVKQVRFKTAVKERCS